MEEHKLLSRLILVVWTVLMLGAGAVLGQILWPHLLNINFGPAAVPFGLKSDVGILEGSIFKQAGLVNTNGTSTIGSDNDLWMSNETRSYPSAPVADVAGETDPHRTMVRHLIRLNDQMSSLGFKSADQDLDFILLMDYDSEFKEDSNCGSVKMVKTQNYGSSSATRILWGRLLVVSLSYAWASNPALRIDWLLIFDAKTRECSLASRTNFNAGQVGGLDRKQLSTLTLSLEDPTPPPKPAARPTPAGVTAPATKDDAATTTTDDGGQ